MEKNEPIHTYANNQNEIVLTQFSNKTKISLMKYINLGYQI